MEMGLSLNLGMKLEQKLTPQLIQSLKILQANSLELEQIIAEELQVNPLLEIEEIGQDYGDDTWEESEKSSEDSSEEALSELKKEDSSEVDWDEYFKEGFDLGYHASDSFDLPEESLERSPTYERSLRDALLEQLADRKISPEVREIVEYLIDSLDEDGLLRVQEELPTEIGDRTVQEIESAILKQKDLFEYSAPVRDAFFVLWSMEPVGIGGRDLQECLLLQFRKKGGSPLAMRILTDAFAMLMKLQVSQMVRALESTPEEIQAALKEISQLDPKPGKGLAPAAAPSVLPDLLVDEDQGELRIILNDKNMPMLRVSNAYKEIYESKRTSKDDKNFLRKKLDGANFLIRSIESRKNTILKTMHAIVRRQREFFDEGPSALKPMILQDIADEIGMHISTVNRVTNGKYVQTRFGVFELKQFFSSSVSQESGEDASATQIKEALRALMDQENPKAPLSDQALADALDKQGIQVARRTVAKYREQMEYLPARLRKKF